MQYFFTLLFRSASSLCLRSGVQELYMKGLSSYLLAAEKTFIFSCNFFPVNANELRFFFPSHTCRNLTFIRYSTCRISSASSDLADLAGEAGEISPHPKAQRITGPFNGMVNLFSRGPQVPKIAI